MKYLVMRARAKISFIALERRQTVMEVLIVQILASFYLFKQESGISEVEEYISKLEDQLIENFNHTIPSIMKFLQKSQQIHALRVTVARSQEKRNFKHIPTFRQSTQLEVFEVVKNQSKKRMIIDTGNQVQEVMQNKVFMLKNKYLTLFQKLSTIKQYNLKIDDKQILSTNFVKLRQ